jgi:hypothetical protein
MTGTKTARSADRARGTAHLRRINEKNAQTGDEPAKKNHTIGMLTKNNTT